MSKIFQNNFFTTFLALPLAFVGIPIYLNISDFYAKNFAINIATIGFALVFIRAFDIIQDIFIGRFCDKIISEKFSRQKLIKYSASFLILGFFLSFNPPQNLTQNLALIWFVAALCLTYICFNFTIINFEASIALIAKNDFERISLNSKKEFLGLIGLILAFLSPTILDKLSFDLKTSYLILSLIFAALILFSLPTIPHSKNSDSLQRINLKEVLSNKEFTTFLIIFLLNAIATSLPAANLIFFVRDVLKMEENLGYFLSIYFLSAGFSIVFWKNYAQRRGLVKTWIIAISGAVITFYFAYFLDEKTANYFYLICLLSGFFLGGDLIIPPALLAKITDQKNQAISSYFALWNITTKLGLMIAASLSLIILGKLGYQPSDLERKATTAISLFYAALPCLIKIFVAFFLIKLQRSKKLPSYEN